MSEKTDVKMDKQENVAPKAVGDEALLRELELIKAENRILKDQLAEAKKIEERVIAERKAHDEAERQELIDRIIIYSGGRITQAQLAGKDKETLKEILRTTIAVREDAYAGIAAYYDQKERREKTFLTVGYWDSASKSWKGGIDTA